MAQTERKLARSRHLYKDKVLDETANIGNVAQFVSFNPNLRNRFSRIKGYDKNRSFSSAKAAIAHLLEGAPESSVNVRSFDPDFPESREFLYGLTDSALVTREVERLASAGLHTIVNETVDVNDGGVSGVALGNVVEFAPQDTPRAVEKPGVVSLPRDLAFNLMQTVYGFAPDLDYPENYRVEFSIHPLRRGVRNRHTIIWQVEKVDTTSQTPSLLWPNRFSQFIGDKAFGLLVAHLIGLPVPATTVVPRWLAPFRFGKETGVKETWIRTCPTEQKPGKFTTQRGWTDPFQLLTQEDPAGIAIASVLAQEGVDALYSGASIATENGEPIIEGVRGWGEEFMLGKTSPEKLPRRVSEAVKVLFERAADVLGPVRLEWVFDGTKVWVVQLHRGATSSFGEIIVPGQPDHFRRFDVSGGVDALRAVAADARTKGEGIVLVGNVGVTSHFGDILRRLGVPSKIARYSES